MEDYRMGYAGWGGMPLAGPLTPMGGAFQGVGGAAPTGAFQTTAAVTGPNAVPNTSSSQFGAAIAAGTNAGSAMVYQWSQQTLSQPVFCQPWREGWHKEYREGALLFNCNKAQHHGAHAPMEALASLPVMNYYLDLSANSASVEGGSVQLTNRTYLLGRTVEEFMTNFSFVGIMRNELAVTEKPAYEPYGPTHQRLINCDYGGYTKVPNIFGTDIRRGDVLYLVVRKGRALPSCVLSPTGERKSKELRRDTPTLQIEGAVSRDGGDVVTVGDKKAAMRTVFSEAAPDRHVDDDSWVTYTGKHQFAFQVVNASAGYPIVSFEMDATETYAEYEQNLANLVAQYGGGSLQAVDGGGINKDTFEALDRRGQAVVQRPITIRIGIVKDTAPNPSVAAIKRALRDTRAMDHMPRLGILMGV